MSEDVGGVPSQPGNLPSGTVTFLFTDIEGSTRLWNENPKAMQVALERHDELMRIAIGRSRGYVFKTIGDAFCAAFHTATDAVEAAMCSLLALATEPWPQDARIRVRMALHTGEAQPREADYFGPPLNRVARLLSVGHGEQLLVSAVTRELLHDNLAKNISLRSLGDHRLRDLGRAETVFQLQHPNLRSEFPPLKSLDNPLLPNNLPLQPTSFIGREKEISEVSRLLSRSSLLTLTGSGGCGKSRLALQVAADSLEQYAEGVWLIELAGLADGDLVASDIAQVLRIPERPNQTILKSLTESLRERRTLLLLDNCEHLLATCASVASAILRSCPSVKILATSREPLCIGGEQTFRVPSLSLPDQKEPSTPQSVSQYEAVRLFIDRALLVKPEFAVTTRNAPALAQVCFRLDGIPLAIELAAARVRSISVEEIEKRLDQRLGLLTGGSRSVLPRQQTLRRLIDWSFDLLDEKEKTLFRRLSVFSAGWTLEAVEEVCSRDVIEIWETLDLLTSLVDKSLVVADEKNGHTRYRLLESIREYGRTRLDEAWETEPVSMRHRDYFLSLATKADLKLKGPDQRFWYRKLDEDYENIRSGLEFSLAGFYLDENFGFGCHLARYWLTRGLIGEGLEFIKRILDVSGGHLESYRRGELLHQAAWLAVFAREFALAEPFARECLAISRETGDLVSEAARLNLFGALYQFKGDWDSARHHYEQALSISRQTGVSQACATYLSNLGTVGLLQQDYSFAKSCAKESMDLFEKHGDVHSASMAMDTLSTVSIAEGDFMTARNLLRKCLTFYHEVGDRLRIPRALCSFSLLLFKENAADRSAVVFGTACALWENTGSPDGQLHSEAFELAVQLRTLLGEESFLSQAAEGRAMSMDDAVRFALDESFPPGS